MAGKKTILFHTSSKIIPSIATRFADFCSRRNVQHFVDEAMLELLQNEGFESHAATEILGSHFSDMERYGPDRIICTCTTLSPAIRSLRVRFSMTISTVDEHMIDRLRRISKNPLLVLTSQSTIEASINEFTSLYPEGRVQSVFVDGALDACLAGDIKSHNAMLAEAIASQPTGFDAVVAPQSSMLVALEVLREVCPYPVFNGLESAVMHLMD